ncbi:ATP-dependent helicase/nuclease subunit B [Anoxybacillus voinovskiensis]|uniref:ATP-dependent helicase/deoxyribonuclease subunit B n=1 Tax=Anoxybacteroides voinovskiense TaxID=230470 RepID=A0A840DX53_9BACL|nr:helicase-exonuclease AddAB subunit AddB [Anoxybacillus voinovskiensis]MBB4074588.1 ATP-dependent helicase/nuclease subunit B [Anoxybacillus voinovskiensis]GGJ71961.1 ATP-dependent helicase/deoxyribonuclease subunit B [Anoxybacillus voinovskiensis]
MSLRLIIGRAGSGKTTQCFNEIRQQLRQQPAGPPIIYLVPEQMTFQSEYALVKTPGLGGMIRAQVLSFTRLAWRVLQETGGMSRYHLNETGVRMLLRKIVEKQKEELVLFARAADKHGFIEQLEEMLIECKRYCVTPAQLEQTEKQLRYRASASEKVLADKLKDLRLIYEEFERQLMQRYVDSEDYLRLLAEKIPQSRYIQEADIYVDGFHHFTPQEYIVLEQLLCHAKRVTVALTVDAPYNEHLPHDLHLFRMTGKTYHDLRNLALLNNVRIEEIEMRSENVRHGSEALRHLEKYYDVRPAVTFPHVCESLQIRQAANRRAEVEGIAREIIHLVRDKGYRYRELAVLVRNAEDYRDLVRTVFTDYNIPYFIDEKESMMHHPLIELIRASLEAIHTNWRYEAIFRAVKTDLFFPIDSDIHAMREAMDQLENYVLAQGIYGTKWLERWTYRRYRGLDSISVPQTNEEKAMEEKLNEWREMIATPLLALQKRLKKAKTGRDMCEALYVYLEQLQIPKKLEKLREEAEQSGQLLQARHHEQAWGAVIELLDQYVEILGDETLPVKLVATIIDTGLESLQFSLVPPAIDQVLIAHFDRSRLTDVKCVFIIGVNEGVIPAKKNDGGMLSEQDRELLEHFSVHVAPSSRKQLLDEPFALYLALASPSERLYVTYPLADDDGKSLLPSLMIKRIKEMFPAVVEKQWGNEPLSLSLEEQMSFITNHLTTLPSLTTQLQAWKRQYRIEPIWWDVYNCYAENDEWKERAKKIVNALFYENKPKKLAKTIGEKLYGKKIKASVSRVEQFNRCPFAHFVSYGLRLKERNIFRLEAPDVGQLFHYALKMITDRIRTEKMDWATLSKQTCEQLAHDAVEQIAPYIQQEILLSSHRYHYVKRKLERIMVRTTNVLSEHAKRSGFAPLEVELQFGDAGPLPPLLIPLADGTVLELVGRIDRIDRAESSRGILLRVIDYKSSNKKLDFTEVYYGLTLQMLAYLDVILEYAEQLVGTNALPAGILYFHIHNPIIKSTSGILKAEEAEQKIFESFKMNGLLLDDYETLQLMDTTIDAGKGSAIVPVKINKDGSVSKTSAVVSEEEFALLRRHVRTIFQQVGTQMVDGVVDIAPYKRKNETACQYCEFKAVCQLDEALDQDRYRLLKNATLDALRETGGENQ